MSHSTCTTASRVGAVPVSSSGSNARNCQTVPDKSKTAVFVDRAFRQMRSAPPQIQRVEHEQS
eukprot:2926875-Amphidinium_carterae.2